MIDTHLHLDDPAFSGKVDEIIAQMTLCGVELAINNSCDFATMHSGVALADKYEQIFATVGMHPHDSKSFDDAFERDMRALAANPKVVAVGEIGLDYHYDLSDRDVQRDVFARQIEIADELKLPLTLHIREAYGDALDILRAQKKHLSSGVLWHCYSGSAELARQLVREGHYFAFGGAITFKNAKKEDVITAVPIDRVMTETDSPYMTPVPLRGTINTPCNIPLVLAGLAEVYGTDKQTLDRQVRANVMRYFPKLAAYTMAHEQK